MTRKFAFPAMISAVVACSGARSAGDDFLVRFFGAPPGKGKSFACFTGADDADDALFRLDRASLGECMPLADGDDERAALRRGKKRSARR